MRDEDLLTVAGLTVFTVAVVFVDKYLFGLGGLRVVLGLVFILFIPGYSLVSALFPGHGDLDSIERIALSFGVSIAVVPLIGLGLNYTPWGIRLEPIIFSLSIFVIFMCLISYWRRNSLPSDEAFGFQYSSIDISVFEEDESRLDKALTVILIISIIVSVIALIYVVQMPKRGEKFTEWYVLGPEGKAAGYPNQLEVGEEATVILGAQNHEYSTVDYKAVIHPQRTKNSTQNITEGDNVTVSGYEKDDIFNGADRSISWSSSNITVSLDPEESIGGGITLDHEDKWGSHIIGNATGKKLNFSFTQKGRYKLQFLLIRGETVYREIHLWIRVRSSNSSVS